jgi:hypothetical protein
MNVASTFLKWIFFQKSKPTQNVSTVLEFILVVDCCIAKCDRCTSSSHALRDLPITAISLLTILWVIPLPYKVTDTSGCFSSVLKQIILSMFLCKIHLPDIGKSMCVVGKSNQTIVFRLNHVRQEPSCNQR